jgi:hypothetical protein
MEKHTIIWRGIQVEITFTPEKFGMADHIELRTENKAALPVTETGYRSHFMPIGTVAQYGNPVSFVVEWLDHEAERTGWRGAQLSLF